MPGDLITQDGQLQIGNMLLGVGTQYPVASIEGMDLPPMRTFDVPKTGLDGVTPGLDVYDRRTVRLNIGVDASLDNLVAPKVNLLRQAFARKPSPVPLSFQLRGESRRYLMVLPRRMAVAVDDGYNLGLPSVVVELDAPDPRILAAAEQNVALISAANGVVAVNGGTFSTYPVLKVKGPSSSPIAVSNRGRTVTLNLSLASGEQLVVDFAKRTVLVNEINRYAAVDPTTEWWDLTPGANRLSPNEASVETNSSGWIADANVVLSRSTALSLEGEASLSMAAVAGGDMSCRTDFQPVQGSATYTALASFRAATTGRSVQVAIVWYTIGHAVISTSVGSAVTDGTSGWTQAIVIATSPSSAAFATMYLSVAGAAASEVHFADQMGLFAGTVSDWSPGSANLVGYSGGGSPVTLTWRDAWV